MQSKQYLSFLFACYVSISLTSALGQSLKSNHHTQIRPQSVSNGQLGYITNIHETQVRPTSDMTFAATDIMAQPPRRGYTTRAVQPANVYHSVIEGTAASHPMASPIQATTSAVGDLHTAAGHHHGHAHGKYYEYREVPKKKTWKFGYKRGNHKHIIERHEHGKAGKHPHFKTKVKWHDKKSKGKGIHLWDYNHHDKKHYHHG